jgi:hypothetical protein
MSLPLPSLDLTSLLVLLLGHRLVINNKELTQAVLTRHSRHVDRVEKSGLGVVRVFAAVWTFEHWEECAMGVVERKVAP